MGLGTCEVQSTEIFFHGIACSQPSGNEQSAFFGEIRVFGATQGIVSGQVIRIKYDQLTHKYHNKPIQKHNILKTSEFLICKHFHYKKQNKVENWPNNIYSFKLAAPNGPKYSLT